MTQEATRAPTRLRGVDAARGLALLGMVAVHITPSIGPEGSYSGVHLLASGRAAALFAFLAGVGLALASGGSSPPHGTALQRVWLSTAARAVLLIVVGFILGTLDSGVAVILVYYGALFLVAMPFLGLRARTLLPLAVVWAITTPFLSHALRIDAPLGIYGDPVVESLAEPGALVEQLTLTGYYPVLPWLAYLLAGLGVGRLALATPRVPVRLLISGTALAVSTYLASWLIMRAGVMERLVQAGTGIHPTNRPFSDGVLNTSFYGTSPTTTWWWLTVVSPHTATPFDLLHTIGTSAAVLGLMLLLSRRLHAVLSPLAAMGSMTFTLYTLHVYLLATAVPREVEYAVLIHIMIIFAVAVPWRRFIGRGPLEALAASISAQARSLVPAPRP